MSGQQPQGGAAAGCLSLAFLAGLVTYCTSSNDPEPQPVVAPKLASRAPDAMPAPSAKVTSRGLSNAEADKAAQTVKESFFPDEVDHSGSASYQKEWWMIKGALRQAGYPCAAIALVQQQLDGTFKAACKVRLHTDKYNAFIINPDTRSIVSL